MVDILDEGKIKDGLLPTKSSRGGTVVPELNVLALYKADERYVFIYDDESQADFKNTLWNQAASPELSFNWFDAFLLKEKAHEQAMMFEPQPEAAERIR